MSLKALAKMVKDEIKEQDKTTSERFVEMLDGFLISSRDAAEHAKHCIRPSNYYKCMRQIWYKMLEFPSKETYTAKGIRTLNVGTAIHEWVQKEVLMHKDFPITLLGSKDIPSYKEDRIYFFTAEQNRVEGRPVIEIGYIDKRWTNKYHLYSIIDGAFHYENRDYIFEFKTINPEDYGYLYDILPEHKKQISLYSLSTGITNAMVLYMNKGNQQWKAFEIEISDLQRQWAKERVGEIDRHLINLTLPPKEIEKLPKYGPNATSCTYCPYKEICESGKSSFKFKESDGFDVYEG